MSDQTPVDPKGEGQGRGRFTRKGIQLQQATDIEGLKAGAAELVAELDAFEAETEARFAALEGTA